MTVLILVLGPVLVLLGGAASLLGIVAVGIGVGIVTDVALAKASR